MVAGVLTPKRLAEPRRCRSAHRVDGGGVGGPKPRPLRSCRGDDPAVTVVMAVHSSEGTVLINYQWETVTGAGLAAARRAGSPS